MLRFSGSVKSIQLPTTRSYNCKITLPRFRYATWRLMQSYLTDSYQRVKANNFYSLWSLIRNAVNFRLIQQILQVMLMIIPPTLLLKKCEVENKLRIASVKLFKWFHENDIKSNHDKCHFFSSLDITTEYQLSDCSVKNLSSEKLLGVIIDRKLSFNEHFTDLRNNASKKFEALP